jgi:transcriptional regulator with XRE-family HTH domain
MLGYIIMCIRYVLGYQLTYQAESFGDALRQARLQKGWSQRDLSQRAGVPQAHISKIESGAVDLRLSTLVQLARLLDLEPVLAPRVALPAVQAIVREAEAADPARTVREVARNLSTLAGNIRRSRPTDASADQLALLASDVGVLASHPLASSAASELLHLAQGVQAAADNPSRLARAIRRLADRRNAADHGAPPQVRPAYTLHDED